MYQENILDYYKNPRNQGKMRDATIHNNQFNPLCGDQVEVFLKMDGKKISKMTFFGHGCAISQAASSMLAESMEGKKIEDAKKFTPNHMIEMLGIEISPARLKCALLSSRAMKEGVYHYLKEDKIEMNKKLVKEGFIF